MQKKKKSLVYSYIFFSNKIFWRPVIEQTTG